MTNSDDRQPLLAGFSQLPSVIFRPWRTPSSSDLVDHSQQQPQRSEHSLLPFHTAAVPVDSQSAGASSSTRLTFFPEPLQVDRAHLEFHGDSGISQILLNLAYMSDLLSTISI
jgi:hypothetical protein